MAEYKEKDNNSDKYEGIWGLYFKWSIYLDMAHTENHFWNRSTKPSIKGPSESAIQK